MVYYWVYYILGDWEDDWELNTMVNMGFHVLWQGNVHGVSFISFVCPPGKSGIWRLLRTTECQNRCHIECHKELQIECQSICQVQTLLSMNWFKGKTTRNRGFNQDL